MTLRALIIRSHVTVKVWNGTAYIDAPVREWNGTEFIDVVAVKTWDGSAFV